MQGIPEDHAHPNFDHANRIAIFHNGQIANFDDLSKEIAEKKVLLAEGLDLKTMTDS